VVSVKQSRRLFETFECVQQSLHKYLLMAFRLMSVSSVLGMSVDTLTASTTSHDSSSAAEILRLKRQLVVTHQELDEARGGRTKRIP
jgi:hypothetical protein